MNYIKNYIDENFDNFFFDQLLYLCPKDYTRYSYFIEDFKEDNYELQVKMMKKYYTFVCPKNIHLEKKDEFYFLTENGKITNKNVNLLYYPFNPYFIINKFPKEDLDKKIQEYNNSVESGKYKTGISSLKIQFFGIQNIEKEFGKIDYSFLMDRFDLFEMNESKQEMEEKIENYLNGVLIHNIFTNEFKIIFNSKIEKDLFI